MALQQYHVGATYYGYDPSTGELVAFANPDQLRQYFPNGFAPNAPALPSGVDVSKANTTPGQIVSPFSGNQNQTPTTTQQPTTPTGSVTGNAQLDSILQGLQEHINTQLANGQVINPNIEITPATVQQYLDQATNEVSPFYANQIKSIKSDLQSNLDTLQKNYDINKTQTENQFKSDLNSSREQAAGNGTAYSGFRGQNEKKLATDTNLSLEKAGVNAASAAQSAISGAEKVVGSDNLPGNYPSLSEYGANTAGTGSVAPTRSLNFGPIGGVTGTQEYSKAGDIRSLSDFLTNQEVQKRTLAFGG